MGYTGGGCAGCGDTTFLPMDAVQERVGICMNCPQAHYAELGDDKLGIVSCRACGCVVTERAAYSDNHCPLRKW